LVENPYRARKMNKKMICRKRRRKIRVEERDE
jgi:hypothetical protein